MHLAVAAAERGDRSSAVSWLAMTVGLGALFLANQGFEYAEAPFSISSHAYGSIFYLHDRLPRPARARRAAAHGRRGRRVVGGADSRAPAAHRVEVVRRTTGTSSTSCGSAMFATIYLLR